ncbi:MAG TPA: hypothetical protein PLN86_16325 [Candidatus Hydrogenedentes bacterium]|jgi:Na+/phosphate symporter|nr:hypothetical protein [Candidatus Hydrogenedentota bacterium]
MTFSPMVYVYLANGITCFFCALLAAWKGNAEKTVVYLASILLNVIGFMSGMYVVKYF